MHIAIFWYIFQLIFIYVPINIRAYTWQISRRKDDPYTQAGPKYVIVTGIERVGHEKRILLARGDFNIEFLTLRTNF